MLEHFNNVISSNEIAALSNIIQVGDVAFKELLEDAGAMLGHRYLASERGRLRTKLVHIQCEIESHDAQFPFEFSERVFSYNQIIPELRTKKLTLHIARSPRPDILPYSSRYKIDMSGSNEPLCRQLKMEPSETPPYILEPFYGVVVFGGRGNLFATLQFPSPGYEFIADSINIPMLIIDAKSEAADTFNRKKARLKSEFLTRVTEEAM